jgi:hypothetical protein
MNSNDNAFETPLSQAYMMLSHAENSMPYLTALGSFADKLNFAT